MPTQTDTLIIGAGPTGLSAAYHHHRRRGSCLLIEREDRVGGLCRSIYQQGFTFDYAGHIIFTGDPYVRDFLYPLLLGAEGGIHWQYREAWVYSKRTYTRYPFQASTYGLPVEVVKACILGAVEAWKAADPERRPGNFAEFIQMTWGAGIGRHFMYPYNRKLWAMPLEEMSWTWLDGRVPQPNIEQVIDGALQPQPKPMGPNARFGYPPCGGYEALMRGWLQHLDPACIRTGVAVTAVDPAAHEATLSTGETIRYTHLINTAPLPEFLRQVAGLPAEVYAAGGRLRHVSIRCVNLGVARPDVSDKHWIYYPEERPLFHRLFIQSNAAPGLTPPGCSSLTAEISYAPGKPLPAAGGELIRRVIEDCRLVGILRPEDSILTAGEADMPYAYVVPDLHKEAAVALILDELRRQGIISAGRFGEWQYFNTDHCFLAGKRAVEQIESL